MAEIMIQYCYSYRYQELASVLRQIPGAKVTGQHGSRDSFEVYLNGELIFSKLTSKTFPDAKELDKKVRQMTNAGKGTSSQQVRKNNKCCNH